MILDIELTTKFWEGVVMVTVASLICWWLTREKPLAKTLAESN